MTVSHRPKKYARSKRAAAAAPGKKGGELARKGFILTVVDGPNVGKEYFFEHSASIGRVESNDIVLVEPGISREHARVYDDQGIYLLQDNGSANGTRLNGEKVAEPEVLRDGDYITLSQTTLQFSLLDAARGEITAQTSLSEIEASAVDATGTREDVKAARGGLLRTRGRKLLAAVGAVLVLLLGGGLWLKLSGGGPMVQADQSTTPLTYSDDDTFFNSVFGYGKYDQSHMYQVAINFEYLGGRVTLQYGAWGVDKVDELEIWVNDKKAGAVPLTMNRWVYGLKLVVPRDLLKKGQSNQVVFKNTRNPPKQDTWEVCYVQIIQEAIPPPDPREARAQFELAKKAWEDRNIEPGNMYTALEGFKRARDLLEGLPERPALYQDAVDYIEKVDKALTRKFSEGLFSARRHEKLDNDLGKARSVLLQTRRYFHRDDFRYREIQRYLDAYAPQ